MKLFANIGSLFCLELIKNCRYIFIYNMLKRSEITWQQLVGYRVPGGGGVALHVGKEAKRFRVTEKTIHCGCNT